MKNILLLIICVLIFGLVNSCKTRLIHVPVETVKIEKEYIDKWHRDSIYIQDSIIINRGGDTVFIERYKYLYRDKLIRDSIFITDTIKTQVPYPVDVIKEVNRLNKTQGFWIVLGRVFALIILGLLGFGGFKVYKKFF